MEQYEIEKIHSSLLLDLDLITEEEYEILIKEEEDNFEKEKRQRAIDKIKATEIKSRLTDKEYELLKKFYP